jgi:hypothetical protein
MHPKDLYGKGISWVLMWNIFRFLLKDLHVIEVG